MNIKLRKIFLILFIVLICLFYKQKKDNEFIEHHFRSEDLLMEHYEKHGVDMDFNSAYEYEQAANEVINSPSSLHKKEKEDNDDVYYLESTNEIVFVSEDGYIRTYFFPYNGKEYYDEQ